MSRSLRRSDDPWLERTGQPPTLRRQRHSLSCYPANPAAAGPNMPMPQSPTTETTRSTSRVLPSSCQLLRLPEGGCHRNGARVGRAIDVPAAVPRRFERGQQGAQAGRIRGVLKDLADGQGTALPSPLASESGGNARAQRANGSNSIAGSRQAVCFREVVCRRPRPALATRCRTLSQSAAGRAEYQHGDDRHDDRAERVVDPVRKGQRTRFALEDVQQVLEPGAEPLA